MARAGVGARGALASSALVAWEALASAVVAVAETLVGALHVEVTLLGKSIGILLGGTERVDCRTLNHSVRRTREGSCGAIQIALWRVDMCVVERASALRAIIALPVAAACALVVQ